ncbi:ABC ATP-binding isoform 1 [Micractinium conductrix]|uniref:ABC ATP-binding isoform 1 n=1 Tax=Micractinium conductrix TaxID=554055 RepID=A0A2P6V6E7_9CHLO|nr:ABC ATP-binding isoform 1 [Micractinium conductrix]|eukprot:PSC69664.1 ABC ATP-binding isoform 1 [Micractinium conductrix]
MYSVTVGWGRKRAVKTILDGLGGHAAPGQLLAVMGPTGSGKTSLLNALAGRLPTGGTLEGSVTVNGQHRGPGFRSITAFVTQDDVLFGTLTVRETLRFAAGIRLPAAVGDAAKAALVDRVIQHLGLAKSADTLVGGGTTLVRGVSGGERKRTNIGVELLSNPSLLFLDEPTSGLDAFQAQNVMQALLAVAGEGRTVVCTIHQPRSSIYALFDHLCLLSEGRLLYFGAAAGAAGYFAAAGHVCPPHHNPADFLLDLISVDYRFTESEAATRERMRALAQQFATQASTQAQLAGSNGAGAPSGAAPQDSGSSSGGGGGMDAKPRFANGPFREFWLLLGRATRQASRNHAENIALLCQMAVIAAVFAWIYSNTSPSLPGGYQDEISLLFLCAVTVAMNSMMGSLILFSLERQVTDRERASRAYRVGPYYLGRTLVLVPRSIIQNLLFGSVVYWATGLNPTGVAFVLFCCVVICEDMTGQALGLAISAVVPEEKVALAVAPMVVIFLMLFSGFYVSSAAIPPVLKWVKYISHLYYGLQGLAVNNFSGRSGYACPVGAPQPCQLDGADILSQLGFEGDSVGQAFMGLLLLMLGYNVLAYVCLRLRKPRYMPLKVAKPSAEPLQPLQ